MHHEKITSREYKVMLTASLFNGNEADVLKAAGSFWQDFIVMAISKGAKVSGGVGAKEVDKDRTVEFRDTQNETLRTNGYVFRLRDGKAVLKFRSPDRFLAMNRDMSAKEYEGELKFEEDIIPLFTSKYSFSSKIETSEKFDTLKDINKIFKDLKNHIPEWDEDESLQTVGAIMHEKVLSNKAEFSFHDTTAEASITLWYHENKTAPALVEFSFNYQAEDEQFKESDCLTAREIFDGLQTLSQVDPKSKTKTAYVYSL